MSSASHESMPSGGQSRRIRRHPVLGELPAAGEVSIIVDGHNVTARAGETIAAAIFANNITTFRTMPDTGEPRGSFCGTGRCTDCLMTVDGELNVRTCVTPVREGQQIQTQRGLGNWEEVAS